MRSSDGFEEELAFIRWGLRDQVYTSACEDKNNPLPSRNLILQSLAPYSTMGELLVLEDPKWLYALGRLSLSEPT